MFVEDHQRWAAVAEPGGDRVQRHAGDVPFGADGGHDRRRHVVRRCDRRPTAPTRV